MQLTQHLLPSAMARHFKNLLCLSATFCVLICMASAISREGKALLRWKATLQNSTSLSSWSRDNPTCSWNGVYCDDSDRVMYLDLSNFGLNGTLDALCSTTFPHLLELALRNNSLVGAIPTNTSLFLTLQYLDLSLNALSGSIPENLQDMAPNLENLVLSSNMFSGLMPRWLPGLEQLISLDLSDNNLIGGIPKEIGNLTDLEYMDVSWNMFSGGIPKELGNCYSLTFLDLSWNMLSGGVPEELGNITGAISMSFSSNMLSGGLPPSFSRMDKIEVFDAGNNLNLSGNIVPFEWFKNWTNVKVFLIANNSFTGSTIEVFCQQGTLGALDLSNNLLSGFPSCLWNLSSLVFMDLSSNAFVGEVPTLANHSSSLKGVHLANNNFTGCFPLALQNLQSLVHLDLGGNKFSGTIPSWIGASFPLLRILQLRSNMFHGSIPWEISQISHLKLLDLAENNLTGSLPVTFSNFTYIAILQELRYVIDLEGAGTMVYYSLDGHVEIVWKGRDYTFNREISLTVGIDLSSNYLSGEIPAELVNLGVIQFLNLSRNNLSGAIPRNIGNLKNVESLDLSQNKLSGHIPSSISHLMFLNSLNLSNNLLSGEIPTGNQLQTLNDPSIYSNNLGLCGAAVSIPCKSNSRSPTAVDGAKEDHHQLETLWLCYSVIAGTVFGFWVWFGALFFCKIWRFTFFRGIDALHEMCILKMKRS